MTKREEFDKLDKQSALLVASLPQPQRFVANVLRLAMVNLVRDMLDRIERLENPNAR